MNNDQFYPLIKTNIILSVFSFLGCLLIILLYLFRKNLRSFVFSLVFYLSISELINSIANLLSIDKLFEGEINKKVNWVCNLQSVLINYTDFCTLCWTLIITYSIYDLMCNFNQGVNKKRKKFIIIGYTFPLLFAFLYFYIYIIIGIYYYIIQINTIYLISNLTNAGVLLT